MKCGVVAPLDFAATLTPMPNDAVVASVDAITDAGVVLPGVSGEVATAARFAGWWTERHKSAAVPIQGQRIYEVTRLRPPAAVAGRLCEATAGDRELLVTWLKAFYADVGETATTRSR